MKIYMVGGAVRDACLGLPIKERDWVVVGSNAKQLLDQGYKQVGHHFPVFIHPDTGEEYALARTESKYGSGYYGFTCQYHPDVTLEDDLLRRDLTINAMAMDALGNIIDPYNGLIDLRNKRLRHVSTAFSDDPVRVLRIARFAARYYHLGFGIDDTTKHLIYCMGRSGELNYLVPERVWQEWYKSLFEQNPEIFIQVLRDCGVLAMLLPEIDCLFGVPNPLKYHTEIDSGVHTLLTLKAAANLSDVDQKFIGLVRFAAIVHDVGKGVTPPSQWPKHHGHESSGLTIITKLCQRLRVPNAYKQFALQACRYHLILHNVFKLKPNIIVQTLKQIDAFRRPAILHALLNVCEADARGCGSCEPYKSKDIWRCLYKMCNEISAQTAIINGYHGAQIPEYLYQHRLKIVSNFCKDEL